ncbi:MULTISPECIES: hypothetical protein [Streptomyces]|uniref:hypothetical protein n=1 Tax=Streptomyces TaxID=1883 RepID=UPI001CEF671C|nr:MULTISPECIES: hypothetical protein [Streptomyces]
MLAPPLPQRPGRHAFALVENAGADQKHFGELVADRFAAMAPATAGLGAAPAAEDTTSPAVVAAGAAPFRAAREQGVDTALLTTSAGATTGI